MLSYQCPQNLVFFSIVMRIWYFKSCPEHFIQSPMSCKFCLVSDTREFGLVSNVLKIWSCQHWFVNLAFSEMSGDIAVFSNVLRIWSFQHCPENLVFSAMSREFCLFGNVLRIWFCQNCPVNWIFLAMFREYGLFSIILRILFCFVSSIRRIWSCHL